MLSTAQYQNEQTKYIYICGSDGSGKSTQIKLLSEYFDTIKEPYEYCYFRYPRFFTKILLFIAKILNYTKYVSKGNVKLWYHEIYRSSILSVLYPIIFIIDVKILWKIKLIHISNNIKNVILDRFILDILIDVMVETNNYDLHNSKIGKMYIKTIPNNTKIVMLFADYDIIKNRRPDLMIDEWLKKRILLYEKISQKYEIIKINADQSPLDIHKQLINIFFNNDSVKKNE